MSFIPHRKPRNRLQEIVNIQYSGNVCRSFEDIEVLTLTYKDHYCGNDNFLEGVTPILGCQLCPSQAYSNIVASVDDLGFLYIHDINKINKHIVKYPSHKNAVFSLAWAPNNLHLLTLSGDHSAKLWDLNEGRTEMLSCFRGHTMSVKTADFRPNDPATFVTGARDGNIMVWDIRSHSKSSSGERKPDQIIYRAATDNVHDRNPVSGITAAVYRDSNSLLVAGSKDQHIRLWDMRKTYSCGKKNRPKTQFSAPRNGYTDIKINSEATKLYANCLLDNIYCFNLNSTSCEPIAEFAGHQSKTYYVKISVSKDGNYLLSGSLDKQVHVWSTKQSLHSLSPIYPLIKLGDENGHQAEVTGVDICQNGLTKIVSCADDGTIRTWFPSFNHSNLISDECIENKLFHRCYRTSQQDAIYSAVDSLSILRMSDQANFAGLEGTSDSTSMEQPSNTTENLVPNGCDRQNQYYTIISNNTETNDALSSSSKYLSDSVKRKRGNTPSPTRTPQKFRIVLSPSKRNNQADYISPTANLPNYVLDGSGPSHRCTRQKENVDWLTQMRRTKRSDRTDRSTEKSKGDSGKKKTPGRAKNEKMSSKKTLLEFYQKSSKSSDESVQKNT